MTKKKPDFTKEREIFLEHIQKTGLRRTGQRDLIMEIFLRTEEHLTSEDLYWLVQKEDPTVGHTTVYRTLKLLTEAGLAREVRFGDNKTYYEHHYNHEHHDHMICTECGTVIEFFSPDIESLQDQLAAGLRRGGERDRVDSGGQQIGERVECRYVGEVSGQLSAPLR